MRCIAFSRVADNEKAEISASFQTAEIDSKEVVAVRAVEARDCVGHGDSPGVDPQFRHFLIDAGRPAFRVEIPTESPNRVEGDEKGGHR